MYFDGKPKARAYVWQRMQEDRVARFPFPPSGRIPNFVAAEIAAKRLFEGGCLDGARCIKVNPDAPQREVRRMALERGVRVLMATPRLRQGFLLLDPGNIDPSDYRRASSLSHVERFAEKVPLDGLPDLDFIVMGAVAVTRRGDRCGKGEGYADLEYAVLRELGHPPVPVFTTVHDVQRVDFFPTYEHDVGLSAIATPTELIIVGGTPYGPRGVDWKLLDEGRLDEMPILKALKARRGSHP